MNKKEVSIILHNIRSAHNVGSVFRTADALGVTRIFLTGYTPTPIDRFGNKRKDIAKVALGAEDTMPWEYKKAASLLISTLKSGGVSIVAVEQAVGAIDYKTVQIRFPVAFVFGNEVKGISKQILKKADIIAEIPMKGKKESLNVSVSLGVALFRMLDR
jgi:23S rRNA (guanosine2251-2'-O)-methyltransferase